jgi:hypothetical protein
VAETGAFRHLKDWPIAVERRPCVIPVRKKAVPLSGKNEETPPMPGKVKKMIDNLIAQKAGSSTVMVNVLVTKLILKGIDPSKFNATSQDDPAMMAKVSAAAKEMGLTIV